MFNTFAGVTCDIAGLFEEPLDVVERYEDRLTVVRQQYGELFGDEIASKHEVSRLEAAIEHLTEDVVYGRITETQLRKKAEDIERHLDHAAKDLAREAKRRNTYDFSELLRDPSLVFPDRVYEVESRTGPIKVSFSEALVKEVFWDLSFPMVKASKHFLKAIAHGASRGKATEGFVRLVSAGTHHLYEVKIVGKGGGSRLYGYDVEGGYYRLIMFSEQHADTVNARSTMYHKL
ncbi:MAG: hypothetical protein KDD37_10420 [Bdellovibrionales bacterium]|nr:hypothetical protein [Bdellovibrionales bacterium]